MAGCEDAGGGGSTPALSTPTETVEDLTGYPSLSLEVSAVDFGAVRLDELATVDFKVANAGNTNLEVSPALSDDASGAFATAVSLEPFVVEAGGEVLIPLTFSPATLVVYNGVFTLETNDESNLSVDVSLTGEGTYPDRDDDGYTADDDCDDADPDIYPGATEVCDGVDANCDGVVDDDIVLTRYPDEDSDGYGLASGAFQTCDGSAGATEPGDCDDADALTYPGATEACDGEDNDCDGQLDEGLTGTFYPDEDNDGYGDEAGAVEGCGGDELITTGGDCDDGDEAVNPAATELCNLVDDDCDSQTDEGLTGTYYADVDGDGFGDDEDSIQGCSAEGYIEQGGDCDDAAGDVFPGAEEQCNQGDDDCDGQTDEGLTGTYFADDDGDGFGDPLNSIEGCSAAGYVSNSEDCDDSDVDKSPAAAEACDGDDNNCNGEIDEGVTTPYYADVDEDGFGDPAAMVEACVAPEGSVENGDDCDDASEDTNPAATELCNEVDDDCDATVDEDGAEDAPTWYRDDDDDGFGVGDRTTVACDRPNGYASLSGDCDDAAPAVNPGADERCDDIDNDCDGSTDEPDAVDAAVVYPDDDGDGYGRSDEEVYTCFPPATHVELDGDCDDTDPTYHPGAEEDDCTDPNDYNCDGSTAYADEDGDGFPACEDCDDLASEVFPGATEICDEQDNNCNGQSDEGVKSTYYIDNDGDGFGALYNTREACEVPEGFTEQGGDCNDYNGAISPGSPELCDEIDNNCNGLADEGLVEVATYPDLDGDGHGATGSRPLETCLSDEDGDGEGETAPYGFSLVDDDCDDSDVLIFAGAPERCDGEDNDCNNLKDESCFEACGGEWPFRPDYSLGTPEAKLIDMNGDNRFETVVQNNFGFAILDHEGSPYYNYSAPNHNYSRRAFVAADIDTYTSFGADTQNVELLTGNGSRPRFYRLNGDKSVTVYERTDITVYDASQFMAADLDFDGSPEFLTTSWCQGSQGVMGFRFDQSTGVIDHINDIPDPDGGCIYTDGRTLTDLDGDGRAELVFGNGYAHSQVPSVWQGDIYALSLTDPTTLSWDYFCDPTGCFDTTLPDYYGGGVSGNLYRQGDRLWAQVTYFSENVDGASNPSATRFWEYDLNGQTLDGSPSTSAPLPWPTDLNRDGVAESHSYVANLGLFDVNSDGYPDQIYSSGTELRLALYNPNTGGFDEVVESRLTVSGTSVAVRALWDSDDDGRLNVISADDSGAVYCHQLGAQSWNPRDSLPPHRTNYLRTNQWDNYEPNEGADTTGDGIPDEVIPVASALTRHGHFYAHLSSESDVDAYRIDTGWSPNICVTAPEGVDLRMKVYSFRDRWNNDTHEPVADGVTDAMIWESTTGEGGTRCFTSGSVAPSRNGEYQFVLEIVSESGASPYWPYWIEARK